MVAAAPATGDRAQRLRRILGADRHEHELHLLRLQRAWNIAFDGTHLWVTNYNGNSLTELNASDGLWVRTVTTHELHLVRLQRPRGQRLRRDPPLGSELQRQLADRAQRLQRLVRCDRHELDLHLLRLQRTLGASPSTGPTSG